MYNCSILSPYGMSCLFKLAFCCLLCWSAAWLGASGVPGHVRSQTQSATASSAPRLGGAAGQPGKNLLRQPQKKNHTVASTHSPVGTLVQVTLFYCRLFWWLRMCVFLMKQGQWCGSSEKTKQQHGSGASLHYTQTDFRPWGKRHARAFRGNVWFLEEN